MLKRYWLPTFAIGWLIAANTALAVPPPKHVSDSPSSDTAAAEQQAEARSRRQEAALIAIKDAIKAALDVVRDAEQRYAPTKDDEQRERDDLKAQQEMADWARWMFWATFASVGFTVVGVVLVYLNLREAKKVTKEAIRSADASEKSAKAAQDTLAESVKTTALAKEANTIARASAIEDQRGWLSIAVGPNGIQSVISYGHPAGGIVGNIKCTITNIGKTPVFNSGTYVQLILRGRGAPSVTEQQNRLTEAMMARRAQGIASNNGGYLIIPGGRIEDNWGIEIKAGVLAKYRKANTHLSAAILCGCYYEIRGSDDLELGMAAFELRSTPFGKDVEGSDAIFTPAHYGGLSRRIKKPENQ